MTTVHDVLAEFRAAKTSNRDLGDKFERLMVSFFQIDPLYAERFSRVWMWNEFPHKGHVGDVGIDLVAEERATGEFTAIQCKFYDPSHTLSKEDIDSFFTAAGKKQFSRCMIVSTTDHWGKNAEDAIGNQSKPVDRVSLRTLELSPIDWSRFSLNRPQDLKCRARKTPKPHQVDAKAKVIDGFKKFGRGKMIMACGTGKTFTSLCIAEAMAPRGHILFLVPSLALMSQSLRSWTAEATHPITAFAVCSDTKVGRNRDKDDNGDIAVYDLAFPATTSGKALVKQYAHLKEGRASSKATHGPFVVFSTYQSIDAIREAQKAGFPEFDLIICDEAHRTTGVTLTGDDESQFVRVHKDEFVKGRKRLYMTATPRIYSDDARSKAQEISAELCSMDNEEIFGPEFYRLGFGEAVAQNLLSDYKVLVLAVDEGAVSRAFQKQFADKESGLRLDDAVRITGCWNGLSKQFAKGSANDQAAAVDPGRMKRAVAFSRSIKDSQAFVQKFTGLVADYDKAHPEEDFLRVELKHVDGGFNALTREERLSWLRDEPGAGRCRILSNARCLSEGVDVPALDAVLFLNPRNSVVDVVQSVGRVMRVSPGKNYGYIILPIGVPADKTPEEALKDHEKYKVVWQVLQALRAHDDRFNAMINQLELNKDRPDNVQVIGVGGGGADGTEPGPGTGRQVEFHFPELDTWKNAIFAKIVEKCGDRRYWENWAKDVGEIAGKHTTRIKALLDKKNSKQSKAFGEFVQGLRSMINPSISEDDAIEMLSQHLITRPVFDALFEGYQFTKQNAVSRAMEDMLAVLDGEGMKRETETLGKFYDSVRLRVQGIDNAEGRQRVVTELYEKFFKTAFKKVSDRLGIVYTPVEVVDFIIRSVDVVLRSEFQSSLGQKDVHIIDPFTGTGTFLVRLLQSGLIPAADLERKYKHELHANEIVLLAYYIAAINIEETFHGLRAATKDKTAVYVPFDGIVLTDTFQISEGDGSFDGTLFPENNSRVKRQKKSPIRVVIGNPPYSVGQGSENDGNKNLNYPVLDERIRSTYAARSEATLKTSLYDSYVRAIRWASDRIQGRGVVGFVTNGSFIDNNAMAGLRACLKEEFSKLYIFNLRGNQRTSGELSRMEGGKIFGSGSRTPVAISILVKTADATHSGTIFYHDIGDYLDREEKLTIIRELGSIVGLRDERQWTEIIPNDAHDWINHRDPAFEHFLPLGDGEMDRPSVFDIYSCGVKTNRDAWVHGFSRTGVAGNMKRMIDFFNSQCAAFAKVREKLTPAELPTAVEAFIDNDPAKISWTFEIKQDLARNKIGCFDERSLRYSAYRPFVRSRLYFSRQFNNRVYQLPRIFPSPQHHNIVFAVTGAGSTKPFSTLIFNQIPDLECISKGQCFPLYIYQKVEDGADESDDLSLPGMKDAEDVQVIDGYRRRSAISPAMLASFRENYSKKVNDEDVFYYVYGILHSPEYRRRFVNDLKKMLPRIPLTKRETDFWAFSRAGRKLAALHLNYEAVEPWPVTEHRETLALDPEEDFLVEKMVFGRPSDEQKRSGLRWDKSTVRYNNRITLTGIPIEAYDYVVNGKPALEWIMERYQVTVDKDSGIRNDPNDWAREHKNPRYIIDLFKRVVRVSMETLNIVESLPPLNERT